jgi:hypothetical protein
MANREAGRLLQGARVYLSGPMDFVASRDDEAKNGWRNRVGEFLRSLGVTVFDPWNKPEVRGLHEYGRETPETARTRVDWTFRPGPKGAAARAGCAEAFWPALHIDLRMVDTSDFIVAYCPTNVYSVGTPHEIILARMQRKPVLFVSPKVEFEALASLEKHLNGIGDQKALAYLEQLKTEVPIKENKSGAPSLWYMPLIGGEHFFDGFGFEPYRNKFNWDEVTPLEVREQKSKPAKPLLPFLEKLATRLPQKWDRHLDRFDVNDDWLLWNIKQDNTETGASVNSAHSPNTK